MFATRAITRTARAAARRTAATARPVVAATALRGVAASLSPLVTSSCSTHPVTAAVRSFSGDAKQSCAQPAADYVAQVLGDDFKPKAGVVLGSGLGGVAAEIQDKVEIPFSDIPGFPRSTVEGHKGQLVCGNLEGVPVIALQGRVHLYEGVDPQTLRVPMYMLKLLGCEAVFLSSAVGSTRTDVGPGELVSVTDHINMQMRNTLIGPNDPIGPRFPSMLNAYDPVFRALMHEAAVDNSIRLTDGVFCSTLGPSFETPAEIRAFRTLGADVVGMSMVAEVTSARHCDLRVAAVAVVVNYASGMTNSHITHDETLHFGDVAAEKLTTLLKVFLKNNSRW